MLLSKIIFNKQTQKKFFNTSIQINKNTNTDTNTIKISHIQEQIQQKQKLNLQFPSYKQKHLIKYNNYQFKPTFNGNKLLVKDLLSEFSSKILKNQIINKDLTIKSTDLLVFDSINKEYLTSNDDVLLRNRIDITKVVYDEDSITQRYITEPISKCYSQKLQVQLNKYVNNKEIQVKPPLLVKNIFENTQSNQVKKMIFSHFINQNSEKLECKETEIDMKPMNITSFKSLIIKKKSLHEGELNENINIIPFSINSFDQKDGFSHCLYENFSDLNRLCMISHRQFQVGVVSDGLKWYFTLFINNHNNLETIQNFLISNPYYFNLNHHSYESNKLFTYFFTVLTGILDDSRLIVKSELV